MISYSRASHYQLKEYHLQKLKKLQKKAQNLKSHIKEVDEFNQEAKQTFYSDWRYSALRLACALPEIQTEQNLSDRFKIPVVEVNPIIQFLLRYGLVKIENEVLKLGKGSTFLDKSSPLLQTHRKNWRLKGIEEMKDPENLFYVGPMCLSKKLAKETKAKLIKLIQETLDEIPKQNAQELVCLNIDFFKI